MTYYPDFGWSAFFGAMAGALVGVGLTGVVINFIQGRMK